MPIIASVLIACSLRRTLFPARCSEQPRTRTRWAMTTSPSSISYRHAHSGQGLCHQAFTIQSRNEYLGEFGAVAISIPERSVWSYRKSTDLCIYLCRMQRRLRGLWVLVWRPRGEDPCHETLPARAVISDGSELARLWGERLAWAARQRNTCSASLCCSQRQTLIPPRL